MSNHMRFTLKVWRQHGPDRQGEFKTYEIDDVSPDTSFLEMLDILNQQLVEKNEVPIAFESDCREGICGSCGLIISGRAHGPIKGTATCQLHMRSFKDDEHITIEPFRSKAFPVIKDLVIDRSAFDKIIQVGGYIGINTGSAQDANAIPIPKVKADEAFDAATCIGCGACVATCKNASAMLFTSAKVSQLALLPQGQVERKKRVVEMVKKHDELGFGHCSNTGACEVECPKNISLRHIARLNWEFLKATFS